MKLQNKKILDFVNANLVGKKLPVKLAYALSVNMEAIKPALTAYNEQRLKIVEKYAKKDEEGKPLSDNGCYIFDDIAGWNDSISELLEAEAEVNITTVSIDDVEKCDDPSFDKLSVIELAAIGFMIA